MRFGALEESTGPWQQNFRTMLKRAAALSQNARMCSEMHNMTVITCTSHAWVTSGSYTCLEVKYSYFAGLQGVHTSTCLT